MWFLKRTQEEDFTEDTLVNSQEFSYDDETNYAAQSLVNLSDRAKELKEQFRVKNVKKTICYTITNWLHANNKSGLIGNRFARKLGVKKTI